jgi:hypothetical protein
MRCDGIQSARFPLLALRFPPGTSINDCFYEIFLNSVAGKFKIAVDFLSRLS